VLVRLQGNSSRGSSVTPELFSYAPRIYFARASRERFSRRLPPESAKGGGRHFQSTAAFFCSIFKKFKQNA
ncbi:hypothetical protein OFM36_29500, partial [Escherichia coli]|nr:hypothetical protein [Escherichia coli]